MGRSSLYRHLRVLKDAGIEILTQCRPNIFEFLEVGFENDEARLEWLRKVVFAVRTRGAENPGAYVKWFADQHLHEVLTAQERGLYDEAVGRGFGRDGWDPHEFLGDGNRGGRRG